MTQNTPGRARRILEGLLLGWLLGWPAGVLADGVLSSSAGPVVVGVAVGLGLALAAIFERGPWVGWGLWWAWLVVLPLWGLGINQSLRHCDACSDNQPLNGAGVWGLYLGYGVAVLAHAIHRRHPEPLARRGEAALCGVLGLGATISAALVLHFGALPILGVAVPIALPVVAPVVALGFFGVALGRRLRGRAAAAGLVDVGLGYGLSLGAYLLAHDLLFAVGPIETFTRTCEGVLALGVRPDRDCHYLCTVAARGHGRLVRPTRMGRRGGRPILVNRQLAVANAFEDLLHCRWPRFGRLCRRVYDRTGWPISGWIRSPWAADAVYLAMKPAEWFFLLALLLLDRQPPEARIDRMYR